MKKYIVVSSNNNPDYYHYAKYLEKAWNSYGWDLCVMITCDVDAKLLELSNPNSVIIKLPQMEGLRDATIAQAGRLYAANYLSLDALIMTSDMDLLPLSDYWKPEHNAITVYGHDLTDYSYYPMGYVAMLGSKWREIFNLSYDTSKDLLRDIAVRGQAYSDEWEQWWNTDWQILTDKLSPLKDQITFIKRGRRKDAGFAFGRIDRGDSMKIIEKPWIDAHMENVNVKHPDKLNKFISLFESIHGKL